MPELKYSYRFDEIMHGFFLREFQPHIKGGRALELGCYQGEFTKLIDPLFDSLTVVDMNPEFLLAAEKALPENFDAVRNFICSKFEEVEGLGHFDSIFLLHSLEHVDDPVLVLKRCREWLKPDGKLFVAVPNAGAMSRRIAVSMGLIAGITDITEHEKSIGHKRTYDWWLFSQDIRRGGFKGNARGLMLKPLANFQLDAALEAGIIDEKYLEGCYELGKIHNDSCASLIAVCGR